MRLAIDFDGVINKLVDDDASVSKKIAANILFLLIEIDIPLINQLAKWVLLKKYKIDIDEEVVKGILRLKERGYEIIILTSNPYWEGIKEGFKRLGIPVFYAKPFEKLYIAKALNAELIDDGYEILFWKELIRANNLISIRNDHNIFVDLSKNKLDINDLRMLSSLKRHNERIRI